jgi:hypothetical protein
MVYARSISFFCLVIRILHPNHPGLPLAEHLSCPAPRAVPLPRVTRLVQDDPDRVGVVF